MHSAAHVAIFDHLSVLGDPVRCRVVRLLEEHELTVSELCEVLQMPQSSVSRHLKLLAGDGWLSSRRDGTSRLYSVPADALDAGARRLWPILREQLGALPAAGQDARRLIDVLAQRRQRSQEFFSTAAGQWDRVREDLFGAPHISRRVSDQDAPEGVHRELVLRLGVGDEAEHSFVLLAVTRERRAAKEPQLIQGLDGLDPDPRAFRKLKEGQCQGQGASSVTETPAVAAPV